MVARIQKFGDRINWISQMRDKWGTGPLQFVRRGQRAEVHEHLSAVREVALTRCEVLMEEAHRLFSSVEWSAEDPKADVALSTLVEICEEIFFSVAAFITIPPPLALLSIHRQAARTLACFGTSLATFLQGLVVPYVEDAPAIQRGGQKALDDASAHVQRIPRLLGDIERSLSISPGWWVVEDQYDVGRAAWEGVGAATATVRDGALSVRERFAEIPGVPALDDAYALQLLPAISLVAYDEVRLIGKAKSARQLLNDAEAGGAASWIADEKLLVQEVWQGHRKFVDQIVQLGFHLQHDSPRRILLTAALDIYSKLIEGPFRHFGTILKTAARASQGKNASFDLTAVDANTPAAVVDYFKTTGVELWDGAETLLRNAEAHYSYEVTDTGIQVIDKARQGSKVIHRHDELLDDDFIEELISLSETLAAFEIALLPYLWEHRSHLIQSALDDLSKDPNERAAVIRAVSGLRGFTEMVFEESESGLKIGTTYLGNEPNAYLEILPTLATIWDAWTVNEVTVHVRGNQPPNLQFRKVDFGWSATLEEQIKNHLVALQLRDIRMRSEEFTIADKKDVDVRYLLLPFFFQVLESAEALGSPWPDENEAESLERYMTWFIENVRDVDVQEDVNSLKSDVIEMAENVLRSMSKWSLARRGRNEDWARRAHRQFQGAIRALGVLVSKASSFMIDQEEESSEREGHADAEAD